MEESVAAYLEYDESASSDEPRAFYMAHGRVLVAFEAAEVAEVVLAFEKFRGGRRGGPVVAAVLEPRGVGLCVRIYRASVPYKVAVLAFESAEPRVEIVRDARRAHDAYAGRQVRVHREHEAARLPFALHVEGAYLRARVYAGVCAPRARDVRVSAVQRRGGILKRLLHGRELRLYLPAEEAPAVVADLRRVSHGSIPAALSNATSSADINMNPASAAPSERLHTSGRIRVRPSPPA